MALFDWKICLSLLILLLSFVILELGFITDDFGVLHLLPCLLTWLSHFSLYLVLGNPIMSIITLFLEPGLLTVTYDFPLHHPFSIVTHSPSAT
jgi:hypothetical protein